MQLIIHEATGDSVWAGYDCPCGCRPSVSYARSGQAVHEGCCCGNEFVIGRDPATPLETRHGFHHETQTFQASWGEQLRAWWLVGPSVHADPAAGEGDGDPHEDRTEQAPGGEAAATVLDPVCGMTVEPSSARASGLHSSYQGRDFHFCGRGCKLDFDEDADRYLDPSYVPAM